MTDPATPTDPADLTVVDAAAALRAGTLSSVELTDACLARIDARDGEHSHDGDPDSINAWVRVYADDARTAARAADAARAAQGAATPALTGIPVGLKDLYAVAGKPLTASSRVGNQAAAPVDSAVWARLRDAGLVLLGHTHTHEWAAGGSTDQVGNPWALDRVAGGSSGGSAAAVAARMVPVATGTDTAGSLRIPSALSGTCAIKPTHGALPTDGLLPLSRSLDHPGPIARTVVDCALVLAALHGRDPAAATPAPGALAGTRIALTPRLDHIQVDPEVDAGLHDAVEAARAAGAEVVEPPPPDADLDVAPDTFGLIAAEMLADHRAFDEQRGDYRTSIQELLAFAEADPWSDEDIRAARARRVHMAGVWTAWMAEHGVEALLEPTVGFVAPSRGGGYDHFEIPDPYTAWTHHWNWTGAPVVALPAGLGQSSGLPVGVSLVGTHGTDLRLLALGAALQAELGVLPDPLAAA